MLDEIEFLLHGPFVLLRLMRARQNSWMTPAFLCLIVLATVRRSGVRGLDGTETKHRKDVSARCHGWR
jgi:hypothetical protein